MALLTWTQTQAFNKSKCITYDERYYEKKTLEKWFIDKYSEIEKTSFNQLEKLILFDQLKVFTNAQLNCTISAPLFDDFSVGKYEIFRRLMKFSTQRKMWSYALLEMYFIVYSLDLFFYVLVKKRHRSALL